MTSGREALLPSSLDCINLPTEGLVAGPRSDVAFKRLRVLHIRLNLPEN
jgi:hypothetical protein